MGAAAAAPLFLLNVDKGLSVAYNDSQAKLATKKGYAMNGCATIRLYKPTKDDSRLRRYEIGFRYSFFVLRFSLKNPCFRAAPYQGAQNVFRPLVLPSSRSLESDL